MATSAPRYAEVAVDTTRPDVRLFSYRVPPDLGIEVGHVVWAPFGRKTVLGVVARLSTTTDYPSPKPLADVAAPALTPAQVATGLWMAERWRCAPFLALRLFLPPDVGQRVETRVRARLVALTPPLPDADARVLAALRRHASGIGLDELERRFRLVDIEAVVERLLQLNLVTVTRRASGPAAPRPDPLVTLRREPTIRGGRPSPLLTRLRRGPALRSELLALAPSAAAVLRRWADQGAITLDATPRHRRPIVFTTAETPPPLTASQRDAWSAMAPRIGAGGAFLLHGVTASGKTELYLRAVNAAIDRGTRSIVLVPEIALTTQTVERFERRFPGRVALLHSRLTDRQRHETARRIASGGADVVVGPRSALFAPLPAVGVIIVDEEHDPSYKSNDPPRYHGRAVALELGRRSGATVILGSATPAVETYTAATHGDLTLLTLPERATGAPPPDVTVVDLRAELRAGNRSIFSRALLDALAGTLARGEQAILFLNRRGSASVVLCRDCGQAARCRRCDAALTYHAASEDLICHVCNRRQPTPQRCPSCGSARIRFLGSGVESVREAAQAAFPTARVGRLDSDVAREPMSADAVLRAFQAGDIDILVGTQLVAKGLDIPGVSLVGVVNADVGLFLPDFRAPERVFQNLMQVAGRSGRRGDGATIIQTYSPDHYVIQAAARQDYARFYEQEIAFRAQHGYPPFRELARLVVHHANERTAQRDAELMRDRLEEARRAAGLAIDVLGPAPAYYRRARGKYRWQIVLRGDDLSAFVANIALPPGWLLDIDPLSLL